jgi:hypothetical protein
MIVAYAVDRSGGKEGREVRIDVQIFSYKGAVLQLKILPFVHMLYNTSHYDYVLIVKCSSNIN